MNGSGSGKPDESVGRERISVPWARRSDVSEWCQAYATKRDRPGYPWHVWLADWLSGRLRGVGL